MSSSPSNLRPEVDTEITIPKHRGSKKNSLSQNKSSLYKILFGLLVVIAVVGIIVVFIVINKAVAKRAFKKKKADAEKELKEYSEWMEQNQKDYARLIQYSQPQPIVQSLQPVTQPTPLTVPPKNNNITNVEPKKQVEKEPTKKTTTKTNNAKTSKKPKTNDKPNVTEKPKINSKPPKSELYNKIKKNNKTKPSVLKINVSDERLQESVIKIMELEQWMEPQDLDKLKSLMSSDKNFQDFMNAIKKLHKQSTSKEEQGSKTEKISIHDFILFYMEKEPEFTQHLIQIGAINVIDDSQIEFSDEMDLHQVYLDYISKDKPKKEEEKQQPIEKNQEPEIKIQQVQSSQVPIITSASSVIPPGFLAVPNIPFVQIPIVTIAQIPNNHSNSFQNMMNEIAITLETATTSQEEGFSPSRIESLDEEDVPNPINSNDPFISKTMVTDFLNQQRKSESNHTKVTSTNSIDSVTISETKIEEKTNSTDTISSLSTVSKPSSQETVEIALEKTQSAIHSSLQNID